MPQEPNKYQWTTHTTKILISEYEAREWLYNVKLETYKNRDLRRQSHIDIAQIISKIQDGCSDVDVRKKINGLRSQYLGEKLKVSKSMKSGSQSDGIYKPSVYWFPWLHFLDAGTDADESRDNIATQSVRDSELILINSDTEISDVENIPPMKNKITSQTSEKVMQPATSKVSKNKPKKYEKKLKAATKKLSSEAILHEASAALKEITTLARSDRKGSDKEDELDIFGKFIVSELRNLKSKGTESLLRTTRKKIQLVLMDSWDSVETQPELPLQGLVHSDLNCAKEFSENPVISPSPSYTLNYQEMESPEDSNISNEYESVEYLNSDTNSA